MGEDQRLHPVVTPHPVVTRHSGRNWPARCSAKTRVTWMTTEFPNHQMNHRSNLIELKSSKRLVCGLVIDCQYCETFHVWDTPWGTYSIHFLQTTACGNFELRDCQVCHLLLSKTASRRQSQWHTRLYSSLRWCLTCKVTRIICILYFVYFPYTVISNLWARSKTAFKMWMYCGDMLKAWMWRKKHFHDSTIPLVECVHVSP